MKDKQPQDKREFLAITNEPTFITELVGDNANYTYAKNIKTAFKLLKKNCFNIVLLDLDLLNDKSSLNLKKYPNIPVIILADQNSVDLAKKAIKAGAQEFLIKDNLTALQLKTAMDCAKQRSSLIDRQNFQLKERLKELQTITKISKIIEKTRAHELKNMLQKIIDVIPNGFLHPSLTAVRLTACGFTLQSSPFPSETVQEISCALSIDNGPAGKITIYLKKTKTSHPEKVSFLPEEGALLKNISVQITNFINRQKSTQELLDREKRFRNFFNAAPVALFEENFSAVTNYVNKLRKNGTDDLREHFYKHPETLKEACDLMKITNVNDAAVTLFEAKNKRQLINDIKKTYIKYPSQLLAEKIITLSEGNSTWKTESRRMTLQGNPIYAQLELTTTGALPGVNAPVYLALTDITERKKREKELETSYRRLELAKKAGQIGIWYWNIPEDNVEIDERIGEIFGQKVTKLDEVLNIVYPEDRAKVEKAVNKSFTTGADYSLKSRVVNQRTGSVHWVDTRGTCRMQNGKVVELLGTMIDITNQKKLQNKLKNSLQEKNILLKEVHHRVRNNLQIIMGFITLQRRRLKTEEARKALTDFKNRVLSISLLHNLLYETAEIKDISMETYFNKLLHTLADEITERQKNLRLDVNVDSEIHLELDRMIPCGLVVAELATNSLKHAIGPDKGNLVEVTFSKQADNYELKISNNGPSWVPDKPLENTETLGLNLVNNIVKQQLNGQVEFSGGKGSTCTIHFPVK